MKLVYMIIPLALIFSTISGDAYTRESRQINETRAIQCKPNREYTVGPYKLINNTWNIQKNTKSRSCISVQKYHTKVQYSWKWKYYGGSHSGIQAYPSVVFGQSPWYPGVPSTTTLLPAALSDIRRLKIHYSVKEGVNDGWYNLALDGWIITDKNNTPENIQYEYMVWEKYSDITGSGEYIGSVTTTHGGEYKLYIRNSTWGPEKVSGIYIIFVKTLERTSGIIDLDELFTYAKKQGVISSVSYLSDIEFGNEIAHGSGTTTLLHYGIEIE